MFTSNTITPIITAYNASNLFKIDLYNPTALPYTFGINFRIEGDDDTYYMTSYLPNEALLGAGEVTYDSTWINSTGWNFIGKRDDSAYAAIIFNSLDLKQGNNVMIISDDYLRVGLDAFSKKTIYFYIAGDWNSIELITNSLDNNPVTYDEIIQYYFMYNSVKLDASANIIG